MNKKILINEFNKIKQMNWILSSTKGSAGVGTTFEELLGIEKNALSVPDYYGIEIKTKLKDCSNRYITIITVNPDNINQKNIYSFVNKFGYPSKKANYLKVLHHSSNYHSYNNLGLKYKTSIYINYDTKTIHLLFYNRLNNAIEDSLYWSFSELKERISNKIETLAIISAEKKYINNSEYFRYLSLFLFKYRDFNHFLKCIEKGSIRICLKIGRYKTGRLKGKIYNHGISFQIHENDINNLFKKIN